MKKTTKDLMCDTDYFSARRIGPVVVFQPKGNFLLNMTIIKAKEAVLEYFETMLAHPEIRVVLLLAAPRKARREEFLCFFDMVRSSRISKNSVMRLYRTIDQIMLHIIASDLFFIDANCGKILPMNANMALACDYRIIGDNAVFQNPALELGLISKGGGAWFLCRRLGRGRAFDYLLATHGITAQEAVTAGLADKCVPSEHFEKEALAVAEHFAAQPASSLKLSKRLINQCMEGFVEYLEYENQQLLAAMHENQLLK